MNLRQNFSLVFYRLINFPDIRGNFFTDQLICIVRLRENDSAHVRKLYRAHNQRKNQNESGKKIRNVDETFARSKAKQSVYFK